MLACSVSVSKVSLCTSLTPLLCLSSFYFSATVQKLVEKGYEVGWLFVPFLAAQKIYHRILFSRNNLFISSLLKKHQLKSCFVSYGGGVTLVTRTKCEGKVSNDLQCLLLKAVCQRSGTWRESAGCSLILDCDSRILHPCQDRCLTSEWWIQNVGPRLPSYLGSWVPGCKHPLRSVEHLISSDELIPEVGERRGPFLRRLQGEALFSLSHSLRIAVASLFPNRFPRVRCRWNCLRPRMFPRYPSRTVSANGFPLISTFFVHFIFLSRSRIESEVLRCVSWTRTGEVLIG